MAITMNTTKTTTRSTREQAPAEFWANLGFYTTDEDTGEELWVSIGGVPFTEPDGSYSGNSKIVAARNEFISQLMAAGRAGLEPGQEDVLDGLHIRMRRVAIGENAVKPDASVAKAVSAIRLGRAA